MPNENIASQSAIAIKSSMDTPPCLGMNDSRVSETMSTEKMTNTTTNLMPTKEPTTCRVILWIAFSIVSSFYKLELKPATIQHGKMVAHLNECGNSLDLVASTHINTRFPSVQLEGCNEHRLLRSLSDLIRHPMLLMP